MSEVPCLVADFQAHAPQRRHHERDDRENRQNGETGAPWRLDEIERCEQSRLDGEQDQRVRHHQADCNQRDLAMEVIDDVFAPRFGHVAEACRETALQAHYRQAGIAERNRELRPETACRRQWPRHEDEQRGEDEEQVDDDPDGPTHGERRLHGLSYSFDSDASRMSLHTPLTARGACKNGDVHLRRWSAPLPLEYRAVANALRRSARNIRALFSPAETAILPQL